MTACECFKNHSIGEKEVQKVLDKYNIKYTTEKAFKGLVGTKDGNLRYDFVVLDDGNNIKYFIKHDGEQHFSEPGSYYNEFWSGLSS